MDELTAVVESVFGAGLHRQRRLPGGCIAAVSLLELEDGRKAVAKVCSEGDLTCEAWMLDYLARRSSLPIPRVLHASDRLLLLEHVEGQDPLDSDAERHAAELLANLHSIPAARFGLERDTLIGPLRQPNPRHDRWVPFFAEQRLLHFGRMAYERGRLPDHGLHDLERLAGRLERWLDEPEAPALLHGDLWDGNILVRKGRIAAFLDPAIYYGHPEVELAFTTLFGTFGRSFFERYGEIRPIAAGFFECRRDLYNLYPLLVHTVLFGGSYAQRVLETLRRLT